MKSIEKVIITLIITAVFGMFLISCSEGIFNFSESTGNFSFSFVIDNQGTDNLERVVFNFSRRDGDEHIRRDIRIEGDSVDCYVPRVNTGEWTVITTVYLSGGGMAKECSYDFTLELSETVIGELHYWSDSYGRSLDMIWKQSAGTGAVPLVQLESLDVLITSFDTPEGIEFNTTVIGSGFGFDVGLGGLRLGYPDSDFFEYTGGLSRAIGDLSVEAWSDLLIINRKGYSTQGNYSLNLTDLNGIEVSGEDNCAFPFDADGAAAKITSYSGTITLLDGEYQKNGSENAGCYIFYIVEKGDSKAVNGYTAPPAVFAPSGAGDLAIDGGGTPTPGTTGFVVLATVDSHIDQWEIDERFEIGITELSPNELPYWLYMQFGDRINFVGMSVVEYTY